jgi:predicted  nucleic acid-binding Zn-ribbon protein
METELARKSKLITELSESVKREAFEEAYQGLQTEVADKMHSLRQVEEQLQETRVRSAAHIGTLEEELVKRNQTIQKLTFELDNLRRKLQTTAEQAQRARQRETELSATLENDAKVTYNRTPYTLSALLLELNSRDQELHTALQLQQQIESETLTLRAEAQSAQNALRKSEALAQSLTARVEYQESVAVKLSQECSQLREERLHL